MPPDFLDLFEKVPGGSQTSGRRREEVDAQLLGHGSRWICHKNKVRVIRSLFLRELCFWTSESYQNNPWLFQCNFVQLLVQSQLLFNSLNWNYAFNRKMQELIMILAEEMTIANQWCECCVHCTYRNNYDMKLAEEMTDTNQCNPMQLMMWIMWTLHLQEHVCDVCEGDLRLSRAGRASAALQSFR